MSKQQTGLSAFTRKKNAEQQTIQSEITPLPSTTNERERGKGDKVALTVRFDRADWERIHQLAVSEGASIKTLIIRGLSKVFSEKGLPGI